MKSPLRIGLCIGSCLVFCGLSFAASSGHPEFDKRLAEAGLIYTLPAGFVDDGSNVGLEKELSAARDSRSPFVVHRIHSTDGKLTAWVDVRVLRLDVTNQALSISYPILFRSDAAKYCEMVTGSECSVVTELQPKAVNSQYHADFGIIFEADTPKAERIDGHRKARVIAISKPNKGLFYTTVIYNSDDEFEQNSRVLTRMLKFNDQ